MKKPIVSNAVITYKGNLLAVIEGEDGFYKLPGGTPEDGEDLRKTCARKALEKINAQIMTIKELSDLVLREKILKNYSSVLFNPKEIKAIYPVKEMRWLEIKEIKNGKYNVAPNIEYLVEKGEIR